MRQAFLFFLFNLFTLSSYSLTHQDSEGPRFVENLGQWENEIEFITEIAGGRIFFQKDKISWLFYNLPDHVHQSGTHKKQLNKNLCSFSDSIRAHAVDVVFHNSNPDVNIESFDPDNSYRNYFLGKDFSSWASGVRAYSAISYQNIYDGIHLVYNDKNSNLKYDLTVEPGADPSSIRFSYIGQDDIYLSDGNLKIVTSLRNITEKKPYAFQVIDGITKEVTCNFRLINQEVSFEFPEGYNSQYPLIIDPEVVFSTYSGSRADNWGFTATYDEDGHAYSGGIVFGGGFPVTTGAFSVSFSSGVDIGILKYAPDGRRLEYATYLGGDSTEVPVSLVVDNNNNLVILGVTSSSNYPVLDNAFQKDFSGGSEFIYHSSLRFTNGTDIVVSKLSVDGSTLLSSTYIGGTANDGVLSRGNLVNNYGDQFRGEVVVDDDNYIYVASRTFSSDFPVQDAFQSQPGGGADGLILKLDPSLISMVWGSYIGGSDNDAVLGIQLDSDKNIFIAGGTASNNFPGTSGSFRSNYSGRVDGFIAKIANDGSRIISASYLGTSEYDQCYFVQVDAVGEIYVLGQTEGDYPVYNANYHNSNSWQFIHKLSNDLTSQRFSTVVGSSGGKTDFSPTAFLVNDCGQIMLSGWGGVQNDLYSMGSTYGLPITRDAFQQSTDGSDFYIMVLEENANGLHYASFIGGLGAADHVDGGTSRFDKRGVVYQSVCSCSLFNSFPTTPGVWSPTNRAIENGGGCNNALIKFSTQEHEANFVAYPEKGCAPLTVNFYSTGSGSAVYIWDSGDGNKHTSQRGSFSHTYHKAGVYEASLIVYNPSGCDKYDTAYKTIEVLYPEVKFNDEKHLVCYPDSAHLNQEFNAKYNYQWSPVEALSDPSVPDPLAFPEKSTVYSVIVTDENGCEAVKDVEVTVARIDSSFRIENITDCKGEPRAYFSNNSYGPLSFTWDTGDGNTYPENEFEHVYGAFGSYEVNFLVENEECSYEGNEIIEIPEVKYPNLITPNNDGLNDTYQILGLTKNWRFDVYNRWGKPVFSQENYDNSFDGNGLNDGIYYYLITTPREVKCKGWLHLLR